MELGAWLGNFASTDIRSQSFYSRFFTEMLKDGVVLAAENFGWGTSSAQRLKRRLEKELEVIIMKRYKSGGTVYYTWHPQFYANITKMAKTIRKQMR